MDHITAQVLNPVQKLPLTVHATETRAKCRLLVSVCLRLSLFGCLMYVYAFLPFLFNNNTKQFNY